MIMMMREEQEKNLYLRSKLRNKEEENPNNKNH
jgi:hypothetical protein